MGLWRVDDITSNILFRRKKRIWRKQITTAEIKKKEGQEEEEKEEKEKERKKNLGSHLLSIPSVAWYVCKKFRVEGPWMLRCMCAYACVEVCMPLCVHGYQRMPPQTLYDLESQSHSF